MIRLVAVLFLALAGPQWAAAQTSFNKLVVFGTSLSDPGNAFALRGGTANPPDFTADPFLIPDAPYTGGGGGSHHFSNGPTWIEQLARPLGLATDARPVFRSSSKGPSNYAVGGARAREDGINYNLGRQVEKFLQDNAGAAPSGALYVIEMGGNDIRDAMVAYLAAGGGVNGELAAGAVLQGALESIGNNAFLLWHAGARKFLVWNAPNLSLTPAIRGLDRVSPGAALLALKLSAGFNAKLETEVLPNLSVLPGIEIVRLDVFTKMGELVANPAAFGLTNVQSACIQPHVPPFECKNADEYLFWDGIHPTTAAHGIVAQQAAAALRR